MTIKSALLIGFTLFPSVAFAADEAHGEASKGGLPQLDPTWFASQVFWLAICFAILYFIFARKTLPDISNVIENRKNHIESDLEMAEKLTSEADQVQDAYNQGLNIAQNNASDAVKKVEAQAKQRAEETIETFRQKSEQTILTAEQNIQASQMKAMDDMNDIVLKTATEAVEKIIGIKPDANKVQAVLKSMDSNNLDKKVKAA